MWWDETFIGISRSTWAIIAALFVLYGLHIKLDRIDQKLQAVLSILVELRGADVHDDDET